MSLPLSYNIRNVRQRWKVTVLAVGGIALVVAAFITLVALYNGFRTALASTGTMENGLIVQRGSQSELTSGIPRDDADFMSADDRVARDAQGRPLASPELVVAASLPRKGGSSDVMIQVRGVSPRAFDVRNKIVIERGRNLQPGLYEVIIGKRLAERADGVEVGQSIHLRRRDWLVVGVFSAAGSSFESELWGDVNVMAAAFNRVGGYQSLTVRMKDPADIEGWAKQIESSPGLQYQLKPERQYYDDLAGPVGGALLVLAAFVSIVMAVGAVFGAMNTMYAVVAQRTREIATLRALGFRRRSILASFLIESVMIASVAGVVGCGLGMFANWLPTAATGSVTFSELAFAFTVTPQSLALGMGFAVLMGFVGGLLPALRAALLPITKALRDA